MTLSERIITLIALGNELQRQIDSKEEQRFFIQMKNENAWFTQDFVSLSVQTIITKFLDKDRLNAFVQHYQFKESSPPKKVGIVAAGNIPAVSFHDILCVFLSGHTALIKPSSTDTVLIRHILNTLYTLDERTKEVIQFAIRLNGVDALIATGSDNTVKHFEYYFSGVPSIIRSNRTSVAVLSGDEDRINLADLGNDIFTYFGLGCRNVSKLYVPENYDFIPFFESIEYWNTIQLHHKYNNNYDYNKSILLVNQDKHLDNGFLLLKESTELVSPLGVLFYEKYKSIVDLEEKLSIHQQKIQAIVSNMPQLASAARLGGSQQPELDQFADDIDTMQFLLNL